MWKKVFEKLVEKAKSDPEFAHMLIELLPDVGECLDYDITEDGEAMLAELLDIKLGENAWR